MHHQNQADSNAVSSVRLALLVLGFRPSKGWLEGHARLRAVADVVIYFENAASHDGERCLAEQVYLQQSSSNVGVAVAYNQAAELARKLGCSHMLLADQDSELGLSTLAGLLAYTKALPEAAVLAPPYKAPRPLMHHGRWPLPKMGRWGFRLMRTTAVTEVVDILLAISSGSVVNLDIQQQLGGFKARYFIDLVDTEYCLRARAAGFAVKGVPVPPLTHAIGQPQQKRLLGITVYPTHHAVDRHFSLARNRMWTMRLHGGRFPGWLVYEWLSALKLLLKVLLYERQRRQKLWAMLRGTWVGLVQRP